MRTFLWLFLCVPALATSPEILQVSYPLFESQSITYQLQTTGLYTSPTDGKEGKLLLGEGLKGTVKLRLSPHRNPRFAAEFRARLSLKDGNGDTWEPLDEGTSMDVEMALPLEINFVTAGAMAFLSNISYSLVDPIECSTKRISIKSLEKDTAEPNRILASNVYAFNLPRHKANVTVEADFIRNFVGSNDVLLLDVTSLDGKHTTLSSNATSIVMQDVTLPVRVDVWTKKRSSRKTTQEEAYDVEYTISASAVSDKSK